MSTEVLRSDVDADGKQIANLGAPTASQGATYTDNLSVPLPNGVASPGSSFLAAAADHVHPNGASYDLILISDPSSPSASYLPTYGSGPTAGLLVAESWKNLANATIKTVDYTYSSGRVTTEVRKAYDTSTGAVVAQITITYAYLGSILQSSTLIRNVGSSSNAAIDLLLESDPVSASISYAATYGVGGMSDELWSFTGSGLAIKSVHYVYSSGLLSSEIRKVFGANGTTIVGQLTINYAYSSNLLTSITQTRDV